jgi:hypothetical protein
VQVLFLFFSLMIVGCIIGAAQCMHVLSLAYIASQSCWPKVKKCFASMDGFPDRHSRSVVGVGMEKETMLGGFATILFYAMSWALCGIVMFSFLSVRGTSCDE